MTEKSDRLVLIGVAHDDIEAGIWRDTLAQEGIAAYVRSSDPLTPLGVAPLPGSLQVYVHTREERRARWLLGDALANPAASE